MLNPKGAVLIPGFPGASMRGDTQQAAGAETNPQPPSINNQKLGLMPQDIFNIEDIARDLAGQYAQERLSTDEYLTLWEEITRAHVIGNNQNTVTV